MGAVECRERYHYMHGVYVYIKLCYRLNRTAFVAIEKKKERYNKKQFRLTHTKMRLTWEVFYHPLVELTLAMALATTFGISRVRDIV